MMKSEKGVTLVMLAITVVILSIIVVLTVKISINQNIIKTTQEAASDYQESVILETLKTILVSERSLYDDGFINESTMWTNITNSIITNKDLKKYGDVDVTNSSNYLTVTVGTLQYKVTINDVEKL